MEKCNICKRDMSEWGEEGLEHHQHLVATKNLIDGHVHIHGDLDNKDVMKELIDYAKKDIGIEDAPVVKESLKSEYVFHNRQRIGDMLMFTCAIRDFKAKYPNIRVNVISTCGHIWDHNPAIDRTLVATPENTVKIGPGTLTNKSNSLDWHMANAFRVSIEENLKVSIPQGESRPDIWLTEEEYNSPRLFSMPYWIICTTGEKGWGCKMYPTNKWQEVIDQNPDLTFVQIGTAEDNAPRLKGKNVIDHIGKTQSRETGIRDLFKLFLHAEGSIGLVSFHMHLSGALYKPCVVIAGGREPVSFTRYAGHAYLSNDGMLPCAVKACWHCAIDTCTNLVHREDTIEKKIPKCVDIIDSEDITRAIKGYYRGGRLKLGTPCEKPKFKNIVPTPIKLPVPENTVLAAPYGMEWGGGCITDLDWNFIQSVIKQYSVKTVLEFGSGLSTLLMKDAGLDVTTYETNDGWINKLKQIKPDLNLIKWDAIISPFSAESKKFDLAFVDGPAGGVNRELSTRIGSFASDVVIIHDANREYEKIWQDMYLKHDFDGPIKGGHRCHLWVRKNIKPVEPLRTVIASSPVVVPKSKKFIKIVSTARGWGGCSRSVTTIMRKLLRVGHKVEFIPFRNNIGSSEFKQMLSSDLKDVKVSLDYHRVKESCDTFMIYGDDYIWEFTTQPMIDVFSSINAEKKVMMLNFRRGRVGEIPWTRNWDLYAFLNSTQERELLKVHPGVKTKVLPPCTELEDFLAVTPNYEKNLRVRRVSSQNDSKFSKAIGEEIHSMFHDIPDLEMSMLPGPSFVDEFPGFRKMPKTGDPKQIAAYLATGNLFWYSLPIGYMDMGPRVIIEAMAAGLPIVADNWGGAIDRVTPETGWLCATKQEHVQVMREITLSELKKKGEAAKQRAFNEFRPEKWIELLTT